MWGMSLRLLESRRTSETTTTETIRNCKNCSYVLRMTQVDNSRLKPEEWLWVWVWVWWVRDRDSWMGECAAAAVARADAIRREMLVSTTKATG